MAQALPNKSVSAAEQVSPPRWIAPFSWIPWLSAVSGALLIFVLVTWLILVGNELRDFDLSCAQTMQDHAFNNPSLRHFFWLVTWAGGIVSLTILDTAGTLTMFFRREYCLAAIWVLATAGGAILNLSIKETVARVRPIPEMRDKGVRSISNPSYPSGHAMGSAIGMGMWLFAAVIFLRRRSAKALTIAGVILLILLIGFSRIYLRAHWFTDVLGGFALGAAWLLLCLALGVRIRTQSPNPG